MLLYILKNKLENSLLKVSKIIVKKTSLPILSYCLLNTEKNFLKISTTNLESGISVWVLAKIEKEGKICVNPRFFLDLVSGLPEETISLRLDNANLLVEAKTMRAKIKTINPEEFPIIPQIDSLEKIKIKCKDLCQGLLDIINIPSYSIGKPEISGIFFSFEKSYLTLTATDSFRLIEKKIKIENQVPKVYSFILPQGASKEIISIFSNYEGMLDFYISPNQIFIEKTMEEIEHPEIIYTSRLIEGEYPNYQEIIPKKYKTKVILDKETFLKQIKTASLFSSRINEVKLKIIPIENKIEITSQNPELGEYKSEFKGEIEGEEIFISFNYKFLLQGIQIIQEKEILLFLSSEDGPAIIKPKTSEGCFYILMPIKID